ncbi:hypothetical protein ACWNYI_00025 [Candidatus Vidania fulgoroideorum]
MKNIFTNLKSKIIKNKFLISADIFSINFNKLKELKNYCKKNKIIILFCKKNIFKKFYYLLNLKKITKCGNFLFFFNSLNDFMKCSYNLKKNIRIFYINFFLKLNEVKNFDFKILNFKNKKSIFLKFFSFIENFLFYFISNFELLINEKS